MNTIITLFEKTAETYPDKEAVICSERSLSFRELQTGAKAIAARIRKNLAAGSHNCPVPVWVRRDELTIMAFLGVLYSGNYYVPLDPEMPNEKKLSILEDCSPELILCRRSDADAVTQLNYKGSLLFIDEITGEDGGKTFVFPTIEGEDPAYMVYTSGSTGKPKGVLKSHGAVCSFIAAFATEFSLDHEIRMGNQTPFFFDASAKDYFLMVYTGATMDIIPSELFMYPPVLIEHLNTYEINYICWVPTALSMVTQINTFKQVMPRFLKKVYFVGEVFPLKQLRRWMEALPEIEYVNLYGSTELAGIGCFCRLQTDIVPEIIPIGKPLSNCRVFLLDEDGSSVISEKERIGEICISSPALALEYYHDPDKTSRTFVELDPWGEGATRILKTGDMARYDEKGDLIFSSRKDFQIKLMGRRIELGEIETAADKLPEIIRNCCVYDQEKRKVIMYCEVDPSCSWSGRELRAELARHLSDYMVPSSVKIMDKLPLNPNGKIDRNKLKQL